MTSNSIRLIIVSTLFAISTSLSQARIKCWTNSDGIRECGNVVPPEYAQQDTRELNSLGITTKVSKRAKTKEELEAEERKTAEERERQLALKKQKEADQLLLDTFASADDIILAREGKLSALDAEISLREAHMKKLQTSLDKIVAAAADMERRGEIPGEKILGDIRSVRTQIEQNKRYIENKRQEKERVREKYNADLIRYKKLRAEADYQASLEK